MVGWPREVSCGARQVGGARICTDSAGHGTDAPRELASPWASRHPLWQEGCAAVFWHRQLRNLRRCCLSCLPLCSHWWGPGEVGADGRMGSTQEFSDPVSQGQGMALGALSCTPPRKSTDPSALGVRRHPPSVS